MIAGTSNNDTLTGTTGNDEINGYSGNDTIYGGDGNDTIDGGLGYDKLYGGNGDDILIDDVSEFKTNTLDGGEGYDVVKISSIYSGLVNNVGLLATASYGGSLWSSLIYNVEAVYLSGTSDNNLLDATWFSGQTTLEGLDGNDSLVGGSSSDYLSGGSGDDSLVGNSGNDTLIGGSGADNLNGGDGAEILTGGADNDTVTGGGGADTFQFSAEYSTYISGYKTIWGLFKIPVFQTKWQNTSGIDVIKDFNASEGDIIQIDTNSSSSAATLRSNLSFNSSTGQLSFAGNVVATLEGVTSFDTSSVQFI